MRHVTYIATRSVLAATLVLAGCLHDLEPVSYVGQDSTVMTSTGIGGTGSGWLAPPEWQDHPELQWQLVDPTEIVWPPLPLDRLAEVRRGMTRRELIELLGDPDRTGTETTDVDTVGGDWNAEVYVWKYQDSRLTQHEMTRDFEVRLAHVSYPHTYPDRPDVVGPDWVVVSSHLY